MNYGEYDSSKPIDIPPRRPNGGLYTGSEPVAGAGWGNVSIVPDASNYINNKNIQFSEPLYKSTDTIPGGFNRIGNSSVIYPYHKKKTGSLINLEYVTNR
jgi:hypothetical protein